MTPFSRAAAKDAGAHITDLPPVQVAKPPGKESEAASGLRRAPVISICCFFLLVVTGGLVMVFSVNKVCTQAQQSSHQEHGFQNRDADMSRDRYKAHLKLA